MDDNNFISVIPSTLTHSSLSSFEFAIIISKNKGLFTILRRSLVGMESTWIDSWQAELQIWVSVFIIIVHQSSEAMKASTNPRSEKTNSLTE